MTRLLDKQRTIRLPQGLWERLEDWMQATQRDAPGLEIRHSEAIRALLVRALDAEDKRRTRKPKATDGGAE